MKTLRMLVLMFSVMCSAGLMGVPSANAEVQTFLNVNYEWHSRAFSYRWTGDYNIPGWMNDNVSSVRNQDGAHVEYWEDGNCQGRHMTSRESFNDLGAVNDDLRWWENWNDRVSSFRIIF